MVRLLIAMVIGGGVLIYFGTKEFRLSRVANTQPQDITCAELIANGPGDNAHVRINGFVVVGPSCVMEYNENTPDVYLKVWAPIVPVLHPYNIGLLQAEQSGRPLSEVPLPRTVEAIVISKKMKTDSDIMAAARAETIQGLVINTIDRLGSGELKYLREQYPGVDFDKVILIEHDRKPSTPAVMGLYLGGGALLMAVGIVPAIRRFFANRQDTALPPPAP